MQALRRDRWTDGPGSASCGAAGVPARTFVSVAPERSASPLHAASPETAALLAWGLTGQNIESENTGD